MIWAGTGVLWTMAGGVPRSSSLLGISEAKAQAASGFTFLQISDSHIGFKQAANPNALGTLEEAIAKVGALPQKRAFAAGAAVCCVVYTATAVPAETRASIDNFKFEPGTITVPVGTTVVWENKDDIPHTIVSLDGTFRSAALDTDDKFSFMFGKAGMFEYFCSLHPYMKAKVVVAP